MADHPLSQRIADVLALAPDESAIEYEGQWLSWGEVGDAGRVRSRRWSTTADPGRDPAAQPTRARRHVPGGAAGRGDPRRDQPVPRRRPHQADIAALRLPIIIGDPDDLTKLVGQASGYDGDIDIGLDYEPHVTAGRRASRRRRPGVAVRMLTSGTTGPPKRIDLTYDMLAHSVMGPQAEPLAGTDGSRGAAWRS